VDKYEITTTHQALTDYIVVTSKVAWTATVSDGDNWCTLANAGTTGNGTVTVNIAANTGIESPRDAVITFAAGDVTLDVPVSQAGMPVVLTVSETAITVSSEASAETFTVTCNTNWTATTDASWLTFTNGSGDATEGTIVTANIPAHEGYTRRTATITIAAGTVNRTVAVAQRGMPVTAPTTAASTYIWTYGALEMTDYIELTTAGCIAGGAGASNENPDVWTNTRSNTDPMCVTQTVDGKTYYYYNWPFATQKGSDLCPDPWRVPSKDDLAGLAGYPKDELLQDWGGYGWRGDGFAGPGSGIQIWTTTETGAETASFFYVTWGVGFWDGDPKSTGQAIRCVREW
jgi:hypothetical protein